MLLEIRPVQLDDLPAIYAYQLDPEANRMAVSNPRDRASFDEHWKSSLSDPSIVARAILVDGSLVGHVSKFTLEGRDSVGYWIIREQWGKGIATRGLALFLEEVHTRPLFARVARSNPASVRVLEKCGFVVTGYEWAPATDRFPACEEAHLMLGTFGKAGESAAAFGSAG